MTLFGVLAAGVLLLAGVVWLGGKLIALASPLLADINRDGLKSVAEALTTAINRIWEGSGK